MSKKKVDLKDWLFVIILFIASHVSFVHGNDLGEDLKGECIATLPDQGRSELLDVKADLEDSTDSDSSGSTETKSK